MIFDLIYLLLLLTGVIILIENRLSRIINLLAIQGVLLVGPVFQLRQLNDWHAWGLVSLIILFKAILTPWILFWTVKRSRAMENTMPRFGYLATLFFLLVGLVAAVNISSSLEGIPTQVHRIGFSYVFLLIYLGVIAFIVRTHWIPLVAGFVMFENGIFVLAMLLGSGLPIGVELGAFVDAVLVIVSAAALRMSPKTQDGSEVKV